MGHEHDQAGANMAFKAFGIVDQMQQRQLQQQLAERQMQQQAFQMQLIQQQLAEHKQKLEERTMTGHSLVPMSARAAGISYEQLCLQLLADAALDSAPAAEVSA